MRENNLISSFKMTFKIHFLSESRSVKMLIRQNLISNRLMIISRLLLFLILRDTGIPRI
jgi:hypothetical protein